VFRSYQDYVKGREAPRQKNRRETPVQLASENTSDQG